jgi:hypothetical protein
LQPLSFPLLGIDSDSGSEFINDQLYRYCLEEKITFTRGRAGRKNDNAYVEQKNRSVVRRAVGYWRYDSPGQLDLLNTLYARLHFYVNFFLPVRGQALLLYRRDDRPRRAASHGPGGGGHGGPGLSGHQGQTGHQLG